MSAQDVRPIVRGNAAPIHPLLVCFPAACFVGALLTDIVYSQTAEMMWSNFSAWLVSAGVILGWLAVIAWLVDLAGNRYVDAPAPAWVYAIGNLIVLVLATVNMFVHTHDAWTSVVPWGLTLSVATVVVLVLTIWIGWVTIYRRDVEVVTS
jgi:uncharacterized membrane protein